MINNQTGSLNDFFNKLKKVPHLSTEIEATSVTSLTSHEINYCLQSILRDSAYIIDTQASIAASPISTDEQLARNGIVNYLSIIQEIIKAAAEKQSTEKPIVLILYCKPNDQSSDSAANASTDSGAGICFNPESQDHPAEPTPHWISIVYLPKSYTLISGEHVENEKAQWIYIDSLPNGTMPKKFFNSLKNGISADTITPNHQRQKIHIPALYSTATFLNCKNSLLQPINQGNASGYFALYCSLMIVSTGNTTFLSQFTERQIQSAFQIAACLSDVLKNFKHQLIHDFLSAWMHHQQQNPETHKQAQEKINTLSKLHLLNKQQCPLDNLDAYTLNQVQDRHFVMKQQIYQSKPPKLSDLLQDCDKKTIQTWLTLLNQPRALNETIDVHIQSKLSQLKQYENRIQYAISQKKRTWTNYFTYQALQAKDFACSKTFAVFFSKVTESLFVLIEPLVIDYYATSVAAYGGSERTQVLIKNEAKAFFSERFKMAGRYLGYSIGSVFTLSLGLYGNTKSLLISSIAITYFQDTSKMTVIDSTASVHFHETIKPKLSPTSLYRLLMLGGALLESYYLKSPQYFFIFISANSFSQICSYIYENYTPKPKTSHEQAIHDGAGFSITIISQFIGQGLLGFMLYRWNRWHLYNELETKIVDYLSRHELGTKTIIHLDYKARPSLFSWQNNDPITVHVTTFLPFEESLNSAYEKRDCSAFPYNPNTFFFKPDLVCTEPTTISQPILALPAP